MDLLARARSRTQLCNDAPEIIESKRTHSKMCIIRRRKYVLNKPTEYKLEIESNEFMLPHSKKKKKKEKLELLPRKSLNQYQALLNCKYYFVV